MVIFGQTDYKIIADTICDTVNAMRTNMSCIGRSDDPANYGQIQIVNGTRAQISELPHIKF